MVHRPTIDQGLGKVNPARPLALPGVAKRVECGELAPAFGAPWGVGTSNSAGKPERTPYASRGSGDGGSASRSVWSAASLLPLLFGAPWGVGTSNSAGKPERTPYASRGSGDGGST